MTKTVTIAFGAILALLGVLGFVSNPLIGPNAIFAGLPNIVVEVNGRRIQDSMIPATGTVNPGATLLDLSAFGKNAVKKVRIWTTSSFVNLCGQGFYTEPSASLWFDETPDQLNITVEGDSLTQGGYNSPYRPGDDWVSQVCDRLGATNFANFAVGGTGFISDNGGIKTTYIERLSRLVETRPDVLIVAGNHNDVSYTSAQRQQAVSDYLRQARQLLPDALIIVFGNNPLTGENSASGALLAAEQDLAAVVDQLDDPGIVFYPIGMDPNGPWITGTGTVDAPNNTGNMDRFYTTADGHPLQRGYDYFAQRYLRAIRDVFGS